jgi:hypothetical protein
LAFSAALLVTGCGVQAGMEADTSVQGQLLMRGNVHGGQQPVTGSSVYIFTAGKLGNGSAALNVLPQTSATTDSHGNFNLGATFNCVSGTDQAYLVAKGGNPGLVANTNNAALVMVAALGPCSGLSTPQAITINEMTTVAAAWALAPFIQGWDHIGASATNTLGIASAFANAALLVDSHTGTVPLVTPSNLSIETGKLTALANSLAGCVNSNGSNCSTLFSAATPALGSAPTDTLMAAVNVVRNPGTNVTDVFNAGSGFAVFPTTLAQAPHDWTLSMTVKGGGLSSPTSLGMDSQGNVFVAGYYGVLNAFTPQGTPLSATGFGVGNLSESYGLVVDKNDEIWVTTEESPFHYPTRGGMGRFAALSSGTPGGYYGSYSDYSMDYPVGLSTDTTGAIFIANYGNSSGTVLNGTKSAWIQFQGSGNSAFPVAVAADGAGGMWLANQGDHTVTHVASDGTILGRPTCCNGGNGVATDSAGNAWISNYYGTSVSEVSYAGAVLQPGIQAGGISYPSGVVVDGNQDVWVANYRGTSFSKIAGINNAAGSGTALSPSTGFGRDASLLLPFGIGVDMSGDVWVANFANNDLVEFFGLAAPTKTPTMPVPAQP